MWRPNPAIVALVLMGLIIVALVWWGAMGLPVTR
jgi:hypothetical protein